MGKRIALLTDRDKPDGWPGDCLLINDVTPEQLGSYHAVVFYSGGSVKRMGEFFDMKLEKIISTKFIMGFYKSKRYWNRSTNDIISAWVVHSIDEQRHLRRSGWSNVCYIPFGADIPKDLEVIPDLSDHLFIGGWKSRDHVAAMLAATKAGRPAILTTNNTSASEYAAKYLSSDGLIRDIGYVGINEYLSYMQSCAATMLILDIADRTNTFGVTDLVCSLSLGKPVVLTRSKGRGCETYIQNKKTGILVGKEVDEIVAGIDYLYSNKEMMHKETKLVSGEFTFDSYMGRLWKLAQDTVRQ